MNLRPIARLRLALMTLILMTGSAFSQQKVALLVGVSTYREAALSSASPKLAEADAVAVSDALARSGYRVELLTGKNATTVNIRRALGSLKTVSPGDGVVLVDFLAAESSLKRSTTFAPMILLWKRPQTPQERGRIRPLLNRHFCPIRIP